MTAPLFTILIDTFNYARYIEDAVQSVLEQDFPGERYEVLVVDDGSTDDTAARLKKFGDRIQYCYKSNGGQASAFNFGIERARGEYVALLDADDVWLPNKLRRVQEELARAPDTGMAYHRLYEWTADGQVSERVHFVGASGRVTESRFWLLAYPMMQASCLVFRREAMQEILPIPETLRTQADAYLTALIIFVSPVLAIDEYLAKYRVHGANLYQSGEGRLDAAQIRNRMQMREALVAEVRKWLRSRGFDTESGNIRDYLVQWRKAQEVDGFALQSPGRWEYFRHLSEYPRLYRELMGPRQRAYSHLRSLAALVLGYRDREVFDSWWQRVKGGARRQHSRSGNE
jgi:glycosyltransferase involved in cell wall biosynthesis